MDYNGYLHISGRKRAGRTEMLIWWWMVVYKKVSKGKDVLKGALSKNKAKGDPLCVACKLLVMLRTLH